MTFLLFKLAKLKLCVIFGGGPYKRFFGFGQAEFIVGVVVLSAKNRGRNEQLKNVSENKSFCL